MSNHGGKRPGAGRKPGSKGVRTVAATELVREAQERWPDYNPLAALIALAKDAEAKGDVETARQCHASVLPYTAPKYRPIEADPDALCDLEERLGAIRAKHSARALKEGLGVAGLAERLQRAIDERRSYEEELAARHVSARPAPIAPPAPAAEPADLVEPPAVPAPVPAVEPRPLPAADAQIIAAAPVYQPLGLWPEPVAQCSTEYDVFSAYGLD